jgi:TorA maturation chaperone TorD
MAGSVFGNAQSNDMIDQARSDQYRFVSLLLAGSPSVELLAGAGQLTGDDTPFGQAITNLARVARGTNTADVEREFFELFIGVGRGELLPYASFYQTGFLNERPLAEVREDLGRLGIARAEGRYEPEDHIALLFEVMADLTAGALDAEPGTDAAFFHRHIAPWATSFFDDLEVAPSARFYRAVADVGRLLVAIETRAYALAA